MKECAYCAEEIKDEAIKCRYCGSTVALLGRTVPPSIVACEIPELESETKNGGVLRLVWPILPTLIVGSIVVWILILIWRIF